MLQAVCSRLLPARDLFDADLDRAPRKPSYTLCCIVREHDQQGMHIYESADKLHYVIEAALSGFKPEELHITAMADTLTIAVVKKLEKEQYVRRERYTGWATEAA